MDTNIHGTLNILQLAKDLGISRVIHTSTSETYGSAQFVPITEAHPLVAQSPYAASKIGADQMALSFLEKVFIASYNFETIQYLWSQTKQ